MTRVLATYNIKGGVGKTSAAVNLAVLAAREGARTLLWDLDPQGASTYLFRVKPKIKGGGRKLVPGKSDAARLDQGHRPRGPRPAAGGLLLPPHGPGAGRRQAADAAARARARAARRRLRLHLPRLPAEHLAGVARTSSRPPTRCSSRSSPRRSRRARSSSCSEIVDGAPAAAVLLDGRPRKALHREVIEQLSAEHEVLRRRSRPRPTWSGWARAAPRSASSRPAAPRARPTRRCGARSRTRLTSSR